MGLYALKFCCSYIYHPSGAFASFVELGTLYVFIAGFAAERLAD